MHQCFTLAHVEALGSAEEIYTPADRHAVGASGARFFTSKKVSVVRSSVPGFVGMSCLYLRKQRERFLYRVFIYLELQRLLSLAFTNWQVDNEQDVVTLLDTFPSSL